ncbi:damage-inducible protein DinB [Leptospira perolatii]|uniref:Damage-inducible protein DinB n=1 Tax=Leptospira perolatii TaxID=2023191 RepID=A0A2M9ZSI5_9LEPT|nr:DinB family protein [Leptospira perolatii]PJZ71525.1 damage-inducible protein DinB [Leptospira perolatii]PJZ75057.1 damage-inducible protein DinB [Leptospira perolatii]
MIDLEYCKAMASYNRWQNESLLANCSKLEEEELRRDRGLFFKSIFGTWNHLLFIDYVWMDRFFQRPLRFSDPKQSIFSNLGDLQEKRGLLDLEILSWSKYLDADWLSNDLRFQSVMYNKEMILPCWLAVTQFFNHQTHHRSQISTALFQAGVDYGVTDIPAIPEAYKEKENVNL